MSYMPLGWEADSNSKVTRLKELNASTLAFLKEEITEKAYGEVLENFSYDDEEEA